MSECKGVECTHESHSTDNKVINVPAVDTDSTKPKTRKPNRKEVRDMMRKLGYFKRRIPNTLKGIR